MVRYKIIRTGRGMRKVKVLANGQYRFVKMTKTRRRRTKKKQRKTKRRVYRKKVNRSYRRRKAWYEF